MADSSPNTAEIREMLAKLPALPYGTTTVLLSAPSGSAAEVVAAGLVWSRHPRDGYQLAGVSVDGAAGGSRWLVLEWTGRLLGAFGQTSDEERARGVAMVQALTLLSPSDPLASDRALALALMSVRVRRG